MIKTKIFSNELVSNAKAALITSESGNYFMISNDYSKYQGLVINKNMEIYKIIDNIKLKDSKVEDVHFYADKIETYSDKGKQIFCVFNEGLLYETDSEEESEFLVDFRKLFDMNSFGRYYEINMEENIAIIKYNKKIDISEASQEEYEMYCAIKIDSSEINLNKNWKEINYEFDNMRGDVSRRYIFSAFDAKIKRCSISFSENKQEAINLTNKLYEKSIKNNDFEKVNINANQEIQYAYNLSLNALKNLANKELGGIYAGIPWFMQFWTRDSIISSKSFIKIDKNFVKKILYNYAKSIREDGLIDNRNPPSALNSIDSSGLLFFRIKENLDLFNKEELKRIYESLKKSIDSISINHFNEFVLSSKFETWMDTDVRDGARIEIQALFLSMLSLARELASIFSDSVNAKFYLNKEKEFLDNVRRDFLVKGELYDGLFDKTIRPNVFLAYYFYPRMLSNKEWEKVFSNAIEALFLDWGGLSTIDKNDPRYVKIHTGMNNFSYHNGDSWYFINNLVALCCCRINKKRFKKYIDKIVSASTNEILNFGIFGYHSELSSSYKQECNGCLAQTWSSALYIEMINELFP